MVRIEGTYLFIEEKEKLIQDIDEKVFFWDVKRQGDNIKELIDLCESNNIQTVISTSKNIKILSSLLYLSNCVRRYVLIDTNNNDLCEKTNGNIIARMWDTLAICADEDDLTGQAGWFKSNSGEKFQNNEMNEFAENVYYKLSPFLDKNSTVLEIGISSGITCKRIAPIVKKYYGIDVSGEVLNRTKVTMEKCGIENVELIQGEAIDIDALGVVNVDVIILNSVIQYFPGYNYFYDVCKKCIGLLKSGGMIFLGDILDFDMKDEYMKIHVKKTRDLYYSRKQIESISDWVQGISDIKISNKYGEIQNELVKYRFDAILKIKENMSESIRTRYKYAKDFMGEGRNTISLKSIIEFINI